MAVKRSIYTPEVLGIEHIDSPRKIVVFGSNTQGRHGAGLAKVCCEVFGAQYGLPIGFQGNSYAIITTDLQGKTEITIEFIMHQVLVLNAIARSNPLMIFYMTKIATGLAGFTLEEVQSMFLSIADDIPENVILPIEFVPYECQL